MCRLSVNHFVAIGHLGKKLESHQEILSYDSMVCWILTFSCYYLATCNLGTCIFHLPFFIINPLIGILVLMFSYSVVRIFVFLCQRIKPHRLYSKIHFTACSIWIIINMHTHIHITHTKSVWEHRYKVFPQSFWRVKAVSLFLRWAVIISLCT